MWNHRVAAGVFIGDEPTAILTVVQPIGFGVLQGTRRTLGWHRHRVDHGQESHLLKNSLTNYGSLLLKYKILLY